MSDQKPVKRDAAWLDSAMHLVTEYAIASGEYLTTGTRDDVDPFVKARRAVFEHLTAPDPRDVELALCRDLLRSAAPFLKSLARLREQSGVDTKAVRDLIASINQAIGDKS